MILYFVTVELAFAVLVALECGFVLALAGVCVSSEPSGRLCDPIQGSNIGRVAENFGGPQATCFIERGEKRKTQTEMEM